MRQLFVEKNFRAGSLEVIAQANVIIDEYKRQGFSLTLRQLYYQFVARNYIENNQRSYKRLGSIINDARLAGMIDWDSIEDRTRNLEKPSTWNSPADIISSSARCYQENLWNAQDLYVEVWIEKDALIGVIEYVCEEWRVPYFAGRGYVSQSEEWRAGRRFSYQWRKKAKNSVIIYLGDHDPSGIDMTRDHVDRLEMFTHYHDYIDVHRLALNYDQVEEYDPPPNFAKESDSRFEQYARIYGDECWELDALEPTVISDLVSGAISERVDVDRWQEAIDEESENKSLLETVYENWDDVSEYAKRLQE